MAIDQGGCGHITLKVRTGGLTHPFRPVRERHRDLFAARLARTAYRCQWVSLQAGVPADLVRDDGNRTGLPVRQGVHGSM